MDVRGSLEDQTMNMAKSAAKLFEENLRYSNGEPVKVVIADTTIGCVGESAACADKMCIRDSICCDRNNGNRILCLHNITKRMSLKEISIYI